jgi:hypothetical protein
MQEGSRTAQPGVAALGLAKRSYRQSARRRRIRCTVTGHRKRKAETWMLGRANGVLTSAQRSDTREPVQFTTAPVYWIFVSLRAISTRRFLAREASSFPATIGLDLPNPLTMMILGSIPAAAM